MYGDCPYCYRPKGTWKHDPIVLPNGAPYDWISDTELVFEPDINNRWYRGIQQIREDEVQEIQDFLKNLEIDNGVTPLTVFSPLNPTGKFQMTGYHIKEMRDSVEKLLISFGYTKTDYFNYDEAGNHIITPAGDKLDWTDPITTATDLQKFQVKYIHIEDLRHYLKTFWIEHFDNDGTDLLRPIFSDSRSMSVWASYNPAWAYGDLELFSQQNLYGNHDWFPIDFPYTYNQGLAIVGSGASATGSSVIKLEDSKLKINMSVARGSYQTYYRVGMGLYMWWVTNPQVTMTTTNGINNLKFIISGLSISGGSVGIGIKVNVAYNDYGVPKVRTHNFSFINQMIQGDIIRPTLWSGDYYASYTDPYPPSIMEYAGGDWLLEQTGQHGVPSVQVLLANNSWNLINLINSVPTFVTYYPGTGYITWNQMAYQTINPSGLNYVTSIGISEVRLECANVEDTNMYSPGSSTPLSFELDAIKIST